MRLSRLPLIIAGANQLFLAHIKELNAGQLIIRILLQQLKIKVSEALTALQQLRLYKEQQNEGDSGF